MSLYELGKRWDPESQPKSTKNLGTTVEALYDTKGNSRAVETTSFSSQQELERNGEKEYGPLYDAKPQER